MLQLFSKSYTEARALFLESARAVSTDIRSYKHPDAVGLDGEDLFIDACRIGPRSAEVAVVTVSGTHGGEGFCGSAMQSFAMQNRTLSNHWPGVSMLQIHAANPYGMSHGIRVNENGVDLNRNWVDFESVPTPNPLYDVAFDRLPRAEQAGPKIVQAWLRAYRGLVQEFGLWQIDNALTSGQYHRPDGMGFGGQSPEWSRRTIETIIRKLLSNVKHVVYIDWHTLLRSGNGTLIFLCFNDTHDHLYNRVASWWGPEAIAREQVNAKWAKGTPYPRRRPSRHGLMMWGIQNLLSPRADLAGAVIEFCTDAHPSFTPDEMLAHETICEQYLLNAQDLHSESAIAARAYLREATTPHCPVFRRSAIMAGQNALLAALRGAVAWAEERAPVNPGRLHTSAAFE